MALIITPDQSSIPNPIILNVGTPFTFSFTLSGGTGTDCFSSDGSLLPPGLTFTPPDINNPLPSPIGNTLTISGTPTTVGIFLVNLSFESPCGSIVGQNRQLIFQVNPSTPPGFCDATISFTIPNPAPPLSVINFKIQSPLIIIANPTISGLFPPNPVGVAAFQLLIDTNPTYIAFIAANPGSSITIISISPPSGGGFPTSTVVAAIRKPIGLPQTQAGASFSDLTAFFPFTCVSPTPTPKKRKIKSAGAIGNCLDQVYVNITGTPLPQIQYGNCGLYSNPTLMGGNVYRYTKVIPESNQRIRTWWAS